MLKQIIRSNNGWLFMASQFSDLDLFQGLSSKTRKKLYDCAITVKNVLFDTEFEPAPDYVLEENPLMYRIYEAIRNYACVHGEGWYNMPSTKEAMFIVAKVFYREGIL